MPYHFISGKDLGELLRQISPALTKQQDRDLHLAIVDLLRRREWMQTMGYEPGYLGIYHEHNKLEQEQHAHS